MDWLASALPIKPICRFLLNRYLGEILLEKVNLEQLSVDVLNGTGSIADVNLDVQHINQSLYKNSVPFELVDGFIGCIVVHIPYSKLLQDSCTIEISGLEITLQPKPRKTNDLVSSMIESVIASMTTSMDLAKSFVEEQSNGGGDSADQQFQGIDALAQIIQIILSRMKINFNNTVIRLEHFPSSAQDTGVALEIRVDRLEFVDEVVDVAPNATDEPITEQPQSSTAFMNGVVQDQALFNGEILSEAGCSSDSSVYKSCYSGPNVVQSLNNEFTSSTSSANGFESNLASKPLQFAQFSSDKLSIRVRLKNSTVALDGFKNDEVNVELFLGALSLFLTPTQFYLIAEIVKSLTNGDLNTTNDLFSKKGGKPMQEDDFAKVEMDLRRKIEEQRLPTSCFKPDGLSKGNWSGDDKFYTSSKTPWKMKVADDCGDEFTTIPMSCDDGVQDVLQSAQNRGSRHQSSSDCVRDNKNGVVGEKPETSRCKIYLSSLTVVLTHDDPLSTPTTTNLDTSTKQIILNAGSRLKEFRKFLDDAYSKDHLRLTASPFVLEYTQNREDMIQMSITASKLELVECLFDDGSINAEKKSVRSSPIYVEMLSFNETNEATNTPDVYLRVGTENRANYFCTLELNECTSEIDISFVDRLNNLLFCQPCFKFGKPLVNKYLFEVPKSDLSLREDFFEPLEETATTTFTCSIDVLCSNFTINLRVPIPDLRSPQAVDRSPWWIRRVRDDILRFTMEDAKFKTIIGENVSKLGNFIAEFRRGTVYFTESGKTQPVKLLHVFEDAQQICGFEFKWDFVNRSLFDDRAESLSARSNESLLNSLERNCFKISTTLDGPFSKKHVVHENEQLTIVGTKTEVKEFRRKCLKYCEMGVNFRLPSCRLYLPDKEFYELLYNRLVNDLAFWTPSCPGFQNRTQTHVGDDPYNVWVTGLQQEHFAPCKSAQKNDESDSDSESTLKSSMFGASYNGKRKGPHKFSCLLQCGSLDLMMCLSEKNTPASAKLRFQMRNGELFFVYGYENDENTSYFYVTSETASLKHAPENLNLVVVDEVVTDVENSNFAKNHDWINTAEPTPANLALKTENDDNFTFAMRLVFHPKENVKEVLLTLGVRNSTIHYCSMPTDRFWFGQLVNFFDVVDYPVLGFDPPKVINEIHVHAWNLAVQYKPEVLPYALRLYVDSLDISTNLVQESSMFRFHVILEDSSLFLTNRAECLLNLTIRDYICVMKMGFFELILTTNEPPNDENERNRPLQELQIHNDSLEIRTCADSFSILSSIVKYLANGGGDIATENYGPASPNEIDEKFPTNDFPTSNDDEERLRDLMASAMEDVELAPPPPPKAPPRASKNEKTKSTSKNNSNSSSRKPSGPTNEEEFLILDELPGVGIRSKSGEPKIRSLRPSSNKSFVIIDNHVTPPLQRTDPLTTLPNGYPLPLIRYFIRDFTVVWHLYGGRDFEEISEQKAYSRMSEIRHTPKLRQRINEIKRNIFTCGGVHRDHTVHAELFLNKMCLVYELYPPGNPQSARHILTIQDIEIRDHLIASSINKLLYRYTTEQKPKQTYLPMFSVKLLHFVPDSGEIVSDGECCLKVSVLPLRLNIDQDTLQFLSDFGKDFSQTPGFTPPPAKRTSSASSLPGVKLKQTAEETSKNSLNSNEIPPMNSSPELTSLGESSYETPPPLNECLFDDLPSEMTDLKCNFDETFVNEQKSQRPSEEQIAVFDLETAENCRKNNTQPTTTNDIDADVKRTVVTSRNEIQPDGGFYFKSFVFSPSVELKLDYHGKRLQLEQGALPGLLLGLSQLHATELRLKELHYRHGLLGFEKVMTYAFNEWLNDIRRNQVYNIVGGVGPVHTLLQVSQGIIDLFWLPVDQYRRDGHIVKGFQRGAQSFGVSTASAALELTQRLVGAVQGVAEFAFDIVNPEYPPKSNSDILQGLIQPYDFREGVHMACATVRRGFKETAEAITLATQEEKARGRWAVRGVLRQATPTVLRPFVVVSHATAQVLGGLRNQLRPDTWREEQDKWKNE